MEKKLALAVTAIKIASTAFVFSVLFVVLGFTLPNGLGQLINPHSETGSKGMTVVMLIWFAVLVVLIVSLVFVFAAQIRNPTARPVAKSLTVVFGSIIAIVLSALVVSLVASKL